VLFSAAVITGMFLLGPVFRAAFGDFGARIYGAVLLAPMPSSRLERVHVQDEPFVWSHAGPVPLAIHVFSLKKDVMPVTIPGSNPGREGTLPVRRRGAHCGGGFSNSITRDGSIGGRRRSPRPYF